ncbi:MAG: hypothetical protein KDK70_19400, partial [Myxococcales bacterium]|nr:hypothetical protein [Myxococcales bacterium]
MVLRFDPRAFLGTAGLGLLVSMLAGCPGSEVPMLDDGSSSGPTTTAGVCVPGQQISCSCPGTVDGVQVCTGDGSGYEPCQCGDPLPSDSSTGEPSTTDTGTSGTTAPTGTDTGTDTGTTGTTTSATSTGTTEGMESTGTTG